METTEKIEITEKSSKPSKGWIWIGAAVSLVAAILFTACYRIFQSQADMYYEVPVETEENIDWLYQNNLLLYRDLYNKNHNTELDYRDIYYPLSEEMKKLGEQIEQGWETSTDEEYDQYNQYRDIEHARNEIENYFQQMENRFSELNSNYDYMIKDTVSGTVVTNTAEISNLNVDNYYFYLSFLYDENGNASIGSNVKGEDSERLRKIATERIRQRSELSNYTEFLGVSFEYESPVNCEITYGITLNMWQQLQNNMVFINEDYNVIMLNNYYSVFNVADCIKCYALFIIAVILLALFLPWVGKDAAWEMKICRLPLEASAIIMLFIFNMDYNVMDMAAKIGSGIAVQSLQAAGWNHSAAQLLVYMGNIIYVTVLFATAWYVGICLRGIRSYGMKEYIKKRSLIYRFFPFVKSKWQQFYDMVSHFDVTKDAKKMILRIVLVNAVILFVISSLWFGGFAITVVYSLILYFILKKYISDLQKKYSILLGATNEIAKGNLNVGITEDLGVFEPFKPEIIRIQRGFRNAVEEEVKSQRMKTELITNVSHDLKTPLTAIITYIDLLKNKEITEEQREEYLNTLERKSMRLKVLIEDLFEVSKANSRNVTLNIVDVDIMNLVKQVELEMSDKLKEARLEMRMNLSDSKVILPLDSQKTYRIYENLFGNIAKYAMPGTRVYVEGVQEEDTVMITLKNITAEEIHVSAEELTDRFVRGDASRNTEGSGLGLAIAKSFTELQNGKLTLELDGDLFKVTTIWKLSAS